MVVTPHLWKGSWRSKEKRARMFVDGVDRGEHDGAFTHTDVDAAAAHTYRIVLGASRSGFVYANLSGS